MSLITLYLLLLKASLLSFTGLGSLPIIRDDFVVERHAMTDHQLNTAVVAGRAGPGPFGLYLVCIGYTVDGVPGAISAFLALITPAFLALPLMRWLGRHANHPRIRGTDTTRLAGQLYLSCSARICARNSSSSSLAT